MVGVSRRPARETLAFVVALAALATLGGVAAASVAGAAPAAASTAPGTPAAADATAPNATIDHDGERLNVDQAAGQTISGTTTLEEGSTVTVRVRSSGESPFLHQRVVTVAADGSFEATMDFSDVERGVEFSVSIMHNGSTLAQAPAVVGECDPACGESGGSAEFRTSVIQVTQGETAAIGVTLTDRETATVVVGSPETNTRLPVTVTDGNGDGTVVLQVETVVDGPNDAGVAAKASGDSVRVHDDVDRPTAMDPADYDVALYLDGDGEGQNEADIGTLVVTEATEDLGTTRTTESTNATESTTTVGTVYESGTTDLADDSGGFSLGTMGILAVGGVLAVLGVVALVGGLE